MHTNINTNRSLYPRGPSGFQGGNPSTCMIYHMPPGVVWICTLVADHAQSLTAAGEELDHILLIDHDLADHHHLQ